MANKPALHRTARDRVVDILLEHVRQTGEVLTATHYRLAAEQSGYSTRHLRRCVAAGLADQPTDQPGDWLDESCVHAVYLTAGNLAAARQRLLRAGKDVPSESTFKRHIKARMGAVALGYAKDGTQGGRRSQIYLTGTATHRAYQYVVDHTECPVLVVPEGHKTAVRPWITVVMDSHTRYALSVVITFGIPGSEEVRAALAAAFRTRLGPDDQTMVGGLPDMVAWDRGLEFLSELITKSCLRLGVTPVAQPAFSPHLKGVLERHWRYLKSNLLAQLPAYTDAVRDLRGDLMLARSALSQEAFLTRVTDWYNDYNRDHVIRTTRKTPLQAWAEDPAPVRTAPDDLLWQDFLIFEQRHKVGHAGLRFKGIDYVDLDGALDKVHGQRVEIRYLPHDRSFLEVFHGGSHIATAYPADALRPENLEEFLASRARTKAQSVQQFRTANRLRKDDGTHLIAKGKGKNGRQQAWNVIDPDVLDLFAGGEDAAADFTPSRAESRGQGRLL